jgi:hypothetical protein
MTTKDEALQRALSLSGDAKLAHDQCRAVVHLANSLAEIYTARAAIVAHDAKLADLIGEASASAMEWLGDELDAMDAASEDDGWLDHIFEAAQERWPQPPKRKPLSDEQEPVAWKWVLRSDPGHFGYYTQHPSEFGVDVTSEKYEWTPLYTAPPKRKPIPIPRTPDDIRNFLMANFQSVKFAKGENEPDYDDVYEVYVHDLLEAFDNWEDFVLGGQK